MATLADSFLEDLDELDSDPEEEPSPVAQGKKRPREDGAAAEEEEEEEEEDLDQVLGTMQAGLSSVATLRQSPAFQAQMQQIEELLPLPPKPIGGNVEDNAEYKLVIGCNAQILKIDDEVVNVHRFVADLYGKKFPELESLVPSRLDYLKVVRAIGNEMDMTLVDLSQILPNALVISVSMTGSTTSGQPLAEDDLAECIRGCDEGEALEASRATILRFVESRMTGVAPNLCMIIDTVIAAQLMGLAGGLAAMSKIPACNLQVLGQQKKQQLNGFAAAAVLPHTGILYYSTAVQQAPPHLRKRALKLVAAKVALAARVDLYQSEPSGGQGQAMRLDIDEKIRQWQEPPKGKMKKALPVPDERPHKKRGGKRARKFKEKFGMTDMRKDTMRRTFGDFEGEYGDDAMGQDMGMLGKKASGRLRAPVQRESKLAVKKAKKAVQMAAARQTDGFSSLVFTPVNGLELADPKKQEAKVAAANQQWFNQNSGFMSAKPK